MNIFCCNIYTNTMCSYMLMCSTWAYLFLRHWWNKEDYWNNTPCFYTKIKQYYWNSITSLIVDVLDFVRLWTNTLVVNKSPWLHIFYQIITIWIRYYCAILNGYVVNVKMIGITDIPPSEQMWICMWHKYTDTRNKYMKTNQCNLHMSKYQCEKY